MELEIGHRYTVFIPSDPNSETTKQKKTVVLTPENLNVLLMTLTRTLFNQIY